MYVIFQQERYELNLTKRGISMHDFIAAMTSMKTSGLDITILILCEMLNLSCVVLVQDFLWKSHDINIDSFDIYLVMFKSGRFVSATRRDGMKLLVDLPTCSDKIIQQHPDHLTFNKSESGDAAISDSDRKKSVTRTMNLNDKDTMISVADAFSGKINYIIM